MDQRGCFWLLWGSILKIWTKKNLKPCEKLVVWTKIQKVESCRNDHGSWFVNCSPLVDTWPRCLLNLKHDPTTVGTLYEVLPRFDQGFVLNLGYFAPFEAQISRRIGGKKTETIQEDRKEKS